MPVPIPPGMPPWYNRHIACRHCGAFVKAFTPKHPPSWERELEQLNERASKRCYCQQLTAADIRKLMAEPVNPFTEHTLYRVWLSQALQYRYSEHGEGRKHSDEWHRAEHVPGLVIKPPPKEPKNKAAGRSGSKR